MKVNWRNSVGVAPRSLRFADLQLNDTFRLRSGRGAVYAKVRVSGHATVVPTQEFMLELATGKLFEPSLSEVELVPVSVSVDADRPRCY